MTESDKSLLNAQKEFHASLKNECGQVVGPDPVVLIKLLWLEESPAVNLGLTHRYTGILGEDLGAGLIQKQGLGEACTHIP